MLSISVHHFKKLFLKNKIKKVNNNISLRTYVGELIINLIGVYECAIKFKQKAENVKLLY